MATKLRPLDQQVIVITGASSGIGLQTARLAAQRGAKVVLAARSGNTLDEIVNDIRERGGDAISCVADVSDRAALQKVADDAVKQFGRIDTWVNNAGVGMFGKLEDSDQADARRLFDTDFWGVVNGSMIALPHLRKNGGALINVGSEVSEAAGPLLGFYVAAKHAVKGFTDTLRIEIEKIEQAPISITLIQPTAVDTPFDEHSRNFMDEEPDLPTPMIDPKDVAEAILDAAVNPTRDKRVGMMAKVNTFGAKNLPGLADRMAAKQEPKMKRDEPARNPEGTLYTPGESGHAHGDHPQA